MTIKDFGKELEGHEFVAKQVEIHYNPTCSTPSECPFKACLLIDGEERLYEVSCISVGFEGPGPREVAQFLTFLGVKYSRDDIFTKNRQNDSGYIHLEYTIE